MGDAERAVVDADSVRALIAVFDGRDGAGLGAPSLRTLVRHFRAEAARLTEALAEREHELSGAREAHQFAEDRAAEFSRMADRAEQAAAERTRERDAAREALRDILASAVEFDDARIDYVTLQVGRADLDAGRAALSGATPTPPRGDADEAREIIDAALAYVDTLNTPPPPTDELRVEGTKALGRLLKAAAAIRARGATGRAESGRDDGK